MLLKLQFCPATQWTRGLLFIMLPLSGILIILYSAAKFFGILREEHLTIQSETEKNKKAKGEN